MKNKATKFLIKTLKLFSIGFILILLSPSEIFSSPTAIIDVFKPVIAIISGGVLSFGIFSIMKNMMIFLMKIFWSRDTPYDWKPQKKNWDALREIINDRFIDLKLMERKENHLKVEIERKLIDRIVTVERNMTEIKVTVEKKSWELLPDNVNNYKLIRKESRPYRSI